MPNRSRAFFPAMRRPVEQKLREIAEHLATFCGQFRVVSVGEHADSLLAAADGGGLPEEAAG